MFDRSSGLWAFIAYQLAPGESLTYRVKPGDSVTYGEVQPGAELTYVWDDQRENLTIKADVQGYTASEVTAASTVPRGSVEVFLCERSEVVVKHARKLVAPARGDDSRAATVSDLFAELREEIVTLRNLPSFPVDREHDEQCECIAELVNQLHQLNALHPGQGEKPDHDHKRRARALSTLRVELQVSLPAKDAVITYKWSDDRRRLSITANVRGAEYCNYMDAVMLTSAIAPFVLLQQYSEYAVDRATEAAKSSARPSDDDVQKMRVLLAQLVEIDWCIGYALTEEQHIALDNIRTHAAFLLETIAGKGRS